MDALPVVLQVVIDWVIMIVGTISTFFMKQDA